MTPYVSRKLTKKTHTMYNVEDHSVFFIITLFALSM